jgi:(p)ppGpp synthase/HD superfamily hydrolase
MFSAGVERALRAAFEAHTGQLRKGSGSAPYMTHPVHVALILASAGYSEGVLQAALLHDVVEDCPGWTSARVAREFGRDVSELVAELTEDKSKTWEERKRQQIEHVASMSDGALAIKAADKLHNLRTLVDDLRVAPDRGLVWSSFRGGPARTLELARELVDALEPRVDARLAKPLRMAVDELATLI